MKTIPFFSMKLTCSFLVPPIGVMVGLFGALFFTIARILLHPALGVIASTLATVWVHCFPFILN